MLISLFLPYLLLAAPTLRFKSPPLLTLASNLDKNFLATEQNLLKLIQFTPELSKFAELVEKSDVVREALLSDNSLTVFAPDNGKFQLGLLSYQILH